LDLALIAKQDQTEALAAIKGMQNIIISMLGIIIIFAVLLYLALYRSIGKPIKQLVEATRRVAQGNLNHRVDIVRDDEIGTLAKSFNQMTENLSKTTASRDELNKEMSERKQMEEQLKDSERRLMESQRIGAIGYWEYDAQNGQIIWSEQTFRLYERDVSLGPPTAEQEAAYYSPEQACT